MGVNGINTNWAFLAVVNQWTAGRRDVMTVGSLIDAAIVVAEQSGQSVPGPSDVATQMGLAHLAVNGLIRVKHHAEYRLAEVVLTTRGSQVCNQVAQRGVPGRQSARKKIRERAQAEQLKRFRKAIQLKEMPSTLQIIQSMRHLSSLVEEQERYRVDLVGKLPKLVFVIASEDERAQLNALEQELGGLMATHP